MEGKVVDGEFICPPPTAAPGRAIHVAVQESDFRVFICIEQAVFIGLLGGVATIFGNAPSAVFNRPSWKGIDHHNRVPVFAEKSNTVRARFIRSDFAQGFFKYLRGLLIL